MCVCVCCIHVFWWWVLYCTWIALIRVHLDGSFSVSSLFPSVMHVCFVYTCSEDLLHCRFLLQILNLKLRACSGP